MWDNTTTSDGSLDQSVKFFISSDSQLEMSWCDSLHLKILRSVSCEFENFSCQVLEDRSAVNCGGGTNSGVGTYSALQESMNSTDWELFIVNKNCLSKLLTCERKHVHSSKIKLKNRILVKLKNNLLEVQIWMIQIVELSWIYQLRICLLCRLCRLFLLLPIKQNGIRSMCLDGAKTIKSELKIKQHRVSLGIFNTYHVLILI